jgi:hypothetical protein
MALTQQLQLQLPPSMSTTSIPEELDSLNMNASGRLNVQLQLDTTTNSQLSDSFEESAQVKVAMGSLTRRRARAEAKECNPSEDGGHGSDSDETDDMRHYDSVNSYDAGNRQKVVVEDSRSSVEVHDVGALGGEEEKEAQEEEEEDEEKSSQHMADTDENRTGWDGEPEDSSMGLGGQMLEQYLGLSLAAGQLRAVDLSSPYPGHCSTTTLSLHSPSQLAVDSTGALISPSDADAAAKASMMGLSGTSPEASQHSHALKFLRLSGMHPQSSHLSTDPTSPVSSDDSLNSPLSSPPLSWAKKVGGRHEGSNKQWNHAQHAASADDRPPLSGSHVPPPQGQHAHPHPRKRGSSVRDHAGVEVKPQLPLLQTTQGPFATSSLEESATHGGDLTGRRSCASVPAADTAAQRKHMELLERLSSDRRRAKQEEEKTLRMQEARRRRTRDNLLQRAAARQEGGKGREEGEGAFRSVPTYAKETTAAKARQAKLVRESKAADDDDGHEDEAAQRERQRAERRRRDREHKAYLEVLAAKRREEEEARVLETAREVERREAVRKLAAKRLQKAKEEKESKEVDGTAVMALATATPAAPSRPRRRSAGGGLAAVRACRSTSREEGPVSDTDADDRRRLEAAAAVRERAQAHLFELKTRREREEEEEEERSRRRARRASLLRARLAAERREVISQKADASTSTPGEESDGDMSLAPRQVRLSPEELASSLARLSRPPARALREIVGDVSLADYAEWKRRKGLDPETKLFVMTGWYPSVKEGLEARNWIQNTDRDSPYFDLKWTLYSGDAAKSLQPWQMCNHFNKSTAVTTKAGLLTSLRQLRWFANADSDDIIPRSYDLGSPEDVALFADDFCITAAANILKRIVLRADGRNGVAAVKALPVDMLDSIPGMEFEQKEEEQQQQQQRAQEKDGQKRHRRSTSNSSSNSCGSGGGTASELDDSNLDSDFGLSSVGGNEDEAVAAKSMPSVPPPLSARRRPWEPEGDGFLVNRGVLAAALRVCCRLLQASCAGDGDIDDPSPPAHPTSALEREMIALGAAADFTGIYRPHQLTQEVPGVQADKPGNPVHSVHARSKERRRAAAKRASAASAVQVMEPLGAARLARVKTVLGGLRVARPQFRIDGDFGQNIWMVKPAAKSRGRGIACFTDLPALSAYTGMGGAGGGRRAHWVVQKYLENPLLVASRKFDIRQWVLVTDWNPLTVWFYGEAYARFGAEDYTTAEGELGNRFVHLVNNSISKHSDSFGEVATAENGVQVRENMWPCSDLRQFLAELHGGEGDPWLDTVQPRMKEAATWALQCAADSVEHRKNSWELYGYDFMLDDELKPWLIEINSSPACDYSTAVTERYVQNALADLLKVTIDAREWEQGKAPRPDTGLWELIHKGAYLPALNAAYGSDMQLRGTRLTRKQMLGR